jgi:adenylylsulfate kinase
MKGVAVTDVERAHPDPAVQPLVTSAVPAAVLWFTGLSGAGKTTLGRWLAGRLRAGGFGVEELDGDQVRELFPSTGFTRPERDVHIRRIGYMASRLEHHGVWVVASFVSPYTESREFVRRLCRQFLEIYLSTPLSVCEERDVKGLYARARRGELAHFTGIGDPYEPPSRPDLVLDTSTMSVEEAGASILQLIRRRTGASV